MKHTAPGCRDEEKWTRFYKGTTIYTAVMVTLVLLLLIKGLG